jgi:predicted TIM-barrel fold metal-dependent hydrolase
MIVDAHHHVWRRADLPWLDGPMQPRIFGAYEAIRRDYSMTEYLTDIAGLGIEKSVYVQANWARDCYLDEAIWVSSVARETGWPHAIVAYTDLTQVDARPQLDKLAELPLVRGVRMQLHWHEKPQYRFAAKPDIARDPAFIRNVALLADYGYSFDLQVFAGQMAGAAELARDCPEVTFILQHAGMPEDLTDEGWDSWRRGMQLLAAEPNVMTKLSAFGTFVHRVDGDLIARVYRETIAMFGVVRCMFGTNFPIEKLWTDAATLLAAHHAAAEYLPVSDRKLIFGATASQTYRLQ